MPGRALQNVCLSIFTSVTAQVGSPYFSASLRPYNTLLLLVCRDLTQR